MTVRDAGPRSRASPVSAPTPLPCAGSTLPTVLPACSWAIAADHRASSTWRSVVTDVERSKVMKTQWRCGTVRMPPCGWPAAVA